MKLLSARGAVVVHHVSKLRHLRITVAPCKLTKVRCDVGSNYSHYVEDFDGLAENGCA